MSGPLGAGTVITSFAWTGTCDSAVSGPQWGPVRVKSAQRFSTPLTVKLHSSAREYRGDCCTPSWLPMPTMPVAGEAGDRRDRTNWGPAASDSLFRRSRADVKPAAAW